jgi:hypothetical protein
VAVTPSTLKLLFPAFACEADPRLQLFIDQASRRVSESVFGDFYDDAVHNLVAHLLTRDKQSNGGKGFVSSETVGDLSRSYTQAGGILASGYSATAYGQEYLKILRLVQPTPMVA